MPRKRKSSDNVDRSTKRTSTRGRRGASAASTSKWIQKSPENWEEEQSLEEPLMYLPSDTPIEVKEEDPVPSDPLRDPLQNQNFVKDEVFIKEEDQDEEYNAQGQFYEPTNITLYNGDGSVVQVKSEEDDTVYDQDVKEPNIDEQAEWQPGENSNEPSTNHRTICPQRDNLPPEHSGLNAREHGKKFESKTNSRKGVQISKVSTFSLSGLEGSVQQPASPFCCQVQRAADGKMLNRQWTQDDRLDFLKAGRPTECALKLNHVTKKQLKDFPWITGCERNHKIYCWPCLLFDPLPGVWGLPDSGTIDTLAIKHEATYEHRDADYRHQNFNFRFSSVMVGISEGENQYTQGISERQEAQEIPEYFKNEEDDVATQFMEEVSSETQGVQAGSSSKNAYSVLKERLAAPTIKTLKVIRPKKSTAVTFEREGTGAEGSVANSSRIREQRPTFSNSGLRILKPIKKLNRAPQGEPCRRSPTGSEASSSSSEAGSSKSTRTLMGKAQTARSHETIIFKIPQSQAKYDAKTLADIIRRALPSDQGIKKGSSIPTDNLGKRVGDEVRQASSSDPHSAIIDLSDTTSTSETEKNQGRTETTSTQTNSAMIFWSCLPQEWTKDKDTNTLLETLASTSTGHAIAEKIFNGKVLSDQELKPIKSLLVKQNSDEPIKSQPVRPNHLGPKAKRATDVVLDGIPDIVDDLIQTYLSDSGNKQRDWKKIVRHGIPQPTLKGDRSFKWHSTLMDLYRMFPWIAMSTRVLQLLCWPCLLQQDRPTANIILDKTTPPERTGVMMSLEQHNATPKHIEACLRYKMMEQQQRVEGVLVKDLQCLSSLKEHNWRLLKNLIDVVCTVKKNDRKSSVAGDCMGMLQLIGAYDIHVQDFLEQVENTSTSSQEGVPEQIKYYVDIISNVLAHCIVEKISLELSRAKYVAILLFDTTELVSENGRIALIVRYVDENGRIQERFIKFIPAGHNRTWDSMLPYITDTATELGIQNKVIGFSFDDGIVAPAEHDALCRWLTIYYESATFVHDRYFSWNMLFLQSLSHFEALKIFFQHLQVLLEFFKENEMVIKFEVDLKDPITTINNNYEALISLFQHISTAPSKWNNRAIVLAPSMLTFLTKWKTQFLVNALAAVNHGINQFKSETAKFDVDTWEFRARIAMKNLAKMRSQFLTIYSNVPKDKAALPVDAQEQCNIIFDKVIDVAIFLILKRTNMKHFQFCQDAIIRPYQTFTNEKKGAKKLLDALPRIFQHHQKLEVLIQLELIATDSLFRDKNLFEIATTISEYELQDSLPDAVKILNLIMTTPLHWETESRAYDRVAAYVKNRRDLEWQDSLIWLEKEILAAMQEDQSFHEHVTNTYAKIIGLAVKDAK